MMKKRPLPRLGHDFTCPKAYPSYLGVPTRTDCGYYYQHCTTALMFCASKILAYYKIKAPEIERYELHAILADGRRIGLEPSSLCAGVRLTEDLLQQEIEKAFPDISDTHYLEWFGTMKPGLDPKPSENHFLIALRRMPGVSSETFENVYGGVYWCSRWPTENEVKSLLKINKEFEFGIPTKRHSHN